MAAEAQRRRVRRGMRASFLIPGASDLGQPVRVHDTAAAPPPASQLRRHWRLRPLWKHDLVRRLNELQGRCRLRGICAPGECTALHLPSPLPALRRAGWQCSCIHACATSCVCASSRVLPPQDFIGADYGLLNYTTYGPSTDYWLLAVWHAAGVGRAVLGVTPPASRSLRAYAFCGTAPATAVLVLINLSPASSICVSPPAWAAPGSPLTQYSLSPTDGTVTSALADLNGQTLLLQAREGWRGLSWVGGGCVSGMWWVQIEVPHSLRFRFAAQRLPACAAGQALCRGAARDAPGRLCHAACGADAVRAAVRRLCGGVLGGSSKRQSFARSKRRESTWPGLGMQGACLPWPVQHYAAGSLRAAPINWQFLCCP